MPMKKGKQVQKLDMFQSTAKSQKFGEQIIEQGFGAGRAISNRQVSPGLELLQLLILMSSLVAMLSPFGIVMMVLIIVPAFFILGAILAVVVLGATSVLIG